MSAVGTYLPEGFQKLLLSFTNGSFAFGVFGFKCRFDSYRLTFLLDFSINFANFFTVMFGFLPIRQSFKCSNFSFSYLINSKVILPTQSVNLIHDIPVNKVVPARKIAQNQRRTDRSQTGK